MIETPRPLRHLGSGHLIAPELLVRQVLLEGFVKLAGDSFRQNELFQRVDDMLQGSQNEWLDDLRESLLRMSKIGADGGIRVTVGYPGIDGRFPAVSVIHESGAENSGQATIGDVLGQHYHAATGTLHKTKGTAMSSTVQLGAWALSGEESVMLHEVVKHIIFSDKGRLFDAGVLEVHLSDTGFQPEEMYHPRILWVPILRVTMEWTYRMTTRKNPVATTFSFASPSFTNNEL